MTKLIIILGPTGSGKTDVALDLARQFKGEIVNADSQQFYRDMKVGTALPPETYFKEVPHHLFGSLTLKDQGSAAWFKKEADAVIQDMGDRQQLPFVVGGTGLYVKALLYGLFSAPASNIQIRTALMERKEVEGLHALYDELKKVDPKAAEKIHPNDPARIIRALEVYALTGKPISFHQAGHGFAKVHYDSLRIGLKMDREELYHRLDGRVDTMIEAGLEEEVRGLFEHFPDNPVLTKAIGYKEWFAYFEGRMSREEVILDIKKNTRHLAKRQMTWFKKDASIEWFYPQQKEEMKNKILHFLK